jgi:hypothetical protein
MNMRPNLCSHSRSRALAAATVVLALAVIAAIGVAAPPVRPPLAYWAFNCFTTCGDANFSPESISTSAASMISSFEPDSGTNESGTVLNAISPFEARAALTMRTGTGGINNGRDLTWRVDTSGSSAIRVSFAIRRSSGGFSSNQFQYTLDGTTFVNHGAPFDVGSEFGVVSFDLRRVKELNDNPNAGFRIVFSGGSTSSATEFTLIDNLQVVEK